MATKDARSYFISKKAEKKDSQVQVPQLVKTSDNVTVAEVSAINTELKNSCKEKKKYQINLPSKVKDKVGKYAHNTQIWNTGGNCTFSWKISAVHFKTDNH